MQLLYRRLDGLKDVAVINAVDQVGDDFCVGLARKHVAFGFERGTQFVVVFDDAVVHQRHAARLAGGICARAVAEMWVRVVHGRRAMGGPTGVGNTDQAFEMGGLHLLHQLGHARRAAGPLEPACVNRHAAGVIPPVLQPLQALHQDGDDVAGRNGADDATHGSSFDKNGKNRVGRNFSSAS